MREPQPDPDCRKCKHHYVTYEAAWPAGCRAFDFKCKGIPALAVRESSGEACQAFEVRPQGKRATS